MSKWKSMSWEELLLLWVLPLGLLVWSLYARPRTPIMFLILVGGLVIKFALAKLRESRPDSLRVKLRNIRASLFQRMQDIRAIVNSDAAETRALFAKHIGKITLTTSGEQYLASGARRG